MEVEIVNFPETKVAVMEYRGPASLEHESVTKFIKWRIQNNYVGPQHKSYGVHYNSPDVIPEEDYKVDLCFSVTTDIAENSEGVVNKMLPNSRCALTRHLGSRENMTSAGDLYNRWLPTSGETLGDFPVFFHYVNVGPNVTEEEMITDIYLPLLSK